MIHRQGQYGQVASGVPPLESGRMDGSDGVKDRARSPGRPSGRLLGGDRVGGNEPGERPQAPDPVGEPARDRVWRGYQVHLREVGQHDAITLPAGVAANVVEELHHVEMHDPADRAVRVAQHDPARRIGAAAGHAEEHGAPADPQGPGTGGTRRVEPGFGAGETPLGGETERQSGEHHGPAGQPPSAADPAYAPQPAARRPRITESSAP